MDPWHQDLSLCLASGEHGQPDWDMLQQLERAYKAGSAFRRHKGRIEGPGTGRLRGGGTVVWARALDSTGMQWNAFPEWDPYPVSINDVADEEEEREVGLVQAVQAAWRGIAHPERVFGTASGIDQAAVALFMGRREAG